MLRSDDLNSFIACFEAAKASPSITEGTTADKSLYSNEGIYPSEIWRLSKSLQIACSASHAPFEAAFCLEKIWSCLRENAAAAEAAGNLKCKPLSASQSWHEAVSWALQQMPTGENTSPSRLDRQSQVGLACKRMKDRKIEIAFTSFGPEFSEGGRKKLFEQIDCLASLLGGREIIAHVCAIVRDTKSVHDGMWMLGNRVASLYQSKNPSLPLGWLFSVGLRHLKKGRSARKPAVAWKSLVKLVTDMAAVLDCERYSQFEGIDMHPTEFWRSLQDSLFWREFFTVPQVPALVLKSLSSCVPKIIVDHKHAELANEAQAILEEALKLAKISKVAHTILHPADQVEKHFPTLTKLAQESSRGINAKFDDIFIAEKRNQDSVVFFKTETDTDLISMPVSIMVAAVCDLLFRRIWKKAGKSAEKIVGLCFEAALGEACVSKAPNLLVATKYAVENETFEFDIAGRDGDEITLFEVKSKSLTVQTRQGSVFNFIADMSDSFLLLLKQLMTHDKNIRNGFSPIVNAGEIARDLRPAKVAVSPLSYGPISDKAFVNSVIRGLYNISLTPIPGRSSKDTDDIIEKFNNNLKSVQHLISDLAPRRDGKIDIFPYLMDVYWLDLGEALYALSRADTLRNAIAPLRHMTFVTRDFWTEVGFADQQGLTKGKWRQLTPAASP